MTGLVTAWGSMSRFARARFALHKAGQQLMQLCVRDAASNRSITGGGNIGGGTAISSEGSTGSRGSLRWVASGFIRDFTSGFMVSFSGFLPEVLARGLPEEGRSGCLVICVASG